MNIVRLECGPIATNAFFISTEDSPEAILVDAPPGLNREIDSLEKQSGKKLAAVLLTHGHWDHMLDAQLVRDRGEIEIYAHPDDRQLIENPEVMASYAMPGLEWTPATVDHWLTGSETLTLASQEIAVRHVPGHAPGNVLFYFPKAGVAFGGDALFAGGVGRFDLPGGSWEVLEKSIKEQIYTLPEDTVVYPGHGPETTVGQEKQTNPYVQGC